MVRGGSRKVLPFDPTLAIRSAHVVPVTCAVDIDEVCAGLVCRTNECFLKLFAERTEKRGFEWRARRAGGDPRLL